LNLSLYPNTKKIKVRTISDGYGATVVAQSYIQLEKKYYARNFAWQHGWIPDLWNIDRDEVIGETYSNKFKNIFVARKSQEDYLINCNVKSKAIGLPFCYVKSKKIYRNMGSLLVMPTHSTLSVGSKEDLRFINDVKKYKSSFEETYVCLHEEDIKRNRGKIWQNEGFKIVSGASFTDANSLYRMKFLFKSFEFMVTDSIGSHVPYAASSGTRVAIIRSERSRVIDPKEPFYSQKSKSYLRKLSKLAYDLNSPDSSPYPFLFCKPTEAKKHISWGRKEIGLENMLSENSLRDNFGWNDSEYLLQKMLTFLKDLKSMIKK